MLAAVAFASAGSASASVVSAAGELVSTFLDRPFEASVTATSQELFRGTRVGDSLVAASVSTGWDTPGGGVLDVGLAFEDNSDAQILFGTDASAANGVGNASGEGVTGMFFLNSPGDGTTKSTISGTGTFQDISGTIHGFTVYGGRLSVITHDRVLFQFHSGNVATGRMTVWGIAHA